MQRRIHVRLRVRGCIEPSSFPLDCVLGNQYVPRTASPALRNALRVARLTTASQTAHSLDEWWKVAGDAEAHRRSVLENGGWRLADESRTASGIAHGVTSVAIVCATQRPHQLGWVLDNVARQTVAGCRLVLVLNSDSFNIDEVRTAVNERLAGAVVLQLPETESLGACLNAGLGATDARYVAKFDDDDFYAASYLHDQLLSLAASGAAVVGKGSYPAYLAATNRTVLRFPDNEMRFTSFVAGSSLVIDRDAVGNIEFPLTTTGEDSGFLRRCEKAGHLVFSSSAWGYSPYRGAAHTWDIDDDRFSQGARDLGTGSPEDCFAE